MHRRFLINQTGGNTGGYHLPLTWHLTLISRTCSVSVTPCAHYSDSKIIRARNTSPQYLSGCCGRIIRTNLGRRTNNVTQPIRNPPHACELVRLADALKRCSGSGNPAKPQHVRQIDLIHFSHTDYGFTDHPAVCRDMQRRYLDIALDAALATQRAAGGRAVPLDGRDHRGRARLVAGRRARSGASSSSRPSAPGQLEVTALPLNNTPFLSRDQWQTMTHWLPEDLWQQLQPQTAVQNDVNGFPRAGAMALLDRGVRYLFSGHQRRQRRPALAAARGLLVEDARRPAAVRLAEPDLRRRLLLLRDRRSGGAARCRWRPTRATGRRAPATSCATDEASLRAAHRHCLARLRAVRARRLPASACWPSR